MKIMTLTKRYKQILFFSFLLISIFSEAQDTTTIHARADKNRIVIGEQLRLTLEAQFPYNEPMRFFDIDSIPHFEITARQKIDTNDEDGTITLIQVLTLTSFDSGYWVIPAFQLSGSLPLFTDTIPVEVGFSSFDPNQDYHDIKDVIDVPVEEKKEQPWYWYVAATIILLAAIIYMLIRKKKSPVTEKAPLIDPYKEAVQELEKLRKENLPAKLFYTRLVHIFRLYIFRRKGIASMQKTTDDLVLQLGSVKLNTEDYNALAQALRMSDFVKFAKYEPSENDKMDSFNTVKRSIELIEKLSNPVQAGHKN